MLQLFLEHLEAPSSAWNICREQGQRKKLKVMNGAFV